MAMPKTQPEPMKPKEIIDLFYQGLSIDMLSRRVASHDGVGGRKAKSIVMEVLYEHQLRECGKWVQK